MFKQTGGYRSVFGSKFLGRALLAGGGAVTLSVLMLAEPSVAGANPPFMGAGIGNYFRDDFDESSPGWWFTTDSVGNGYVSARSDCYSGGQCANEYGKNPTGAEEALSKVFETGTIPLSCSALIYVKALSTSSVKMTIEDASSHVVIASGAAVFPASTTWQQMFVAGSSPARLFDTKIIVRVFVEGNAGAFQSILFDSLAGSCNS